MADLSNNNGGAGVDTSVDGIRKVVEGALSPDENQDDDDDEGDDTDASNDDDNSGDDAAGDDSKDDSDGDDAKEDEDEDDAESGDKKDPKSDRKFSQFKGDGTDKAYISNLEDGYKNSSAEAIRIKGELETVSGRLDSLLRVVTANPEISKALNAALQGDDKGAGGSGSGSDAGKSSEVIDDPFVKSLHAEWQEKAEQEIQAIIDANPELITDEPLGKRVQHWMSVFSEEYRKENNGKLMGGGDAMLAAMKYLGIEDRRQKQDLAQGAKKDLTPPRSRGNKAKKSGGQKPTFSADQLAMAKAMGHDEAWLQKNAS